MEPYCIFKTKKSRCRSSVRKDLPLLICEQHLKQYYGLEVGYVEIDDVSNIGLSGGLLKPIKGYSIFSRNQVIVPTRNFFDMVYRSMDVSDETGLTRKYSLSNRIQETVREYASSFPDSMEHRQVIETYRNFIESDDVNPGPKQTDELSKLQAAVQANKTRSEVYIRNQPVNKTLLHNLINVNGKPTNMESLKWSKNFQYMVANCMFSAMEIQANQKQYIDWLQFNVQFVPNVGLVATETIADPAFLVIDGFTSGSQIFYNAHVGLLPKIVHDSKYTIKDFPQQYALNEAFKGGTVC